MHTKWGRIASDLREAIQSGEYPPGSKLPAIPVLTSRYDVARDTVRDAISALASEGLVTPLRGVGTVVRETMPVALAYSPQAPARIWVQQTADPKATDIVVEVEWEQADSDLAERLHCASGDQVLHRVRHQSKGGGVAQIHHQWLPKNLVDDIQQASNVDLSNKEVEPPTDLFTLLRQAGTDPSEVTETIGARMPHPEEREVMGLPAGVPVLLTYRITRDNAGRPVETSTMTGASDRMTQTFTVPLH